MASPFPTRRRRPAIEGLEPRSLMAAGLPAIGPTPSPGFAGTTPLPSIPAALYTPPTYATLAGYVAQIKDPAAPPASLGYATKNAAALDTQPALAGPNGPTSAEVAREYFTSYFVGRYTVGPGRQAGQALTIHANNTASASSNQSLTGKGQLILFTPNAVTTAAAPAPGSTVAVGGGQVTGLASFFAQNYLQSGNLVIASVGSSNQPSASAPDLSASTTLTNVRGLLLPTAMPWAFDTTSAGAYTAPLGFTQGGGRLTVKYTPDARPKPGTLGSGKVEVLLQGLMHTSTILNILDKGFN